ncbi:MAG: glycosyltransferase family 2 protein [Chloroflexota bacterium]
MTRTPAADAAGAAVTVVIPTHDHAATLGHAAASILGQTWRALDLVILGDGVDDATRAVARGLAEADPRVRFLDLPKGAGHGEEHRHRLMEAGTAPVVSWMGDDDLAFPDHIAEMLRVLGDGDFAHPLPIVVRDDGTLRYLPAQIAEERWRAWHLHPTPQNTISLTGATYTRAAYARLSRGWEPPPPGWWSDLHMWRAFLALPDLRARTGPRATTVKLIGTDRRGWSAEARAAEIAGWAERIADPAYGATWEALVATAVREAADGLALGAWEVGGAVRSLQARAEAAEAGRAAAETRAAACADAVGAVTGSRSWRWTRPLRAAGRAARSARRRLGR